MVKKLFKHEFLAWLRVMTIVYAVMVTFSAAYRILLCFENDSTAFQVISVLALVIFILFLSVCTVFGYGFGIVRFYKNLFTGEGYLSMTLPVTPAAHIWVKALTAGAMQLITIGVCVLSVVIVTAGDVLTEIWKAGAYLGKQIPAEYAGHFVGYCVEFGIAAVLASVFNPMLYYACICIGQTFRKHRILGAIGVYFAYYYICQILSMVLVGVLAAVGEAYGPSLDTTVDTALTTADYLGAYHVMFGFMILWIVGIGMIYYAICHRIISKKLNLE